MQEMFSQWLGRVAPVLATMVFTLGLTACFHKTTTDKNIDYINTVDAQELVHGKKKLLGIAGTSKAVWLDPRTTTEFRAEHIPGAINLPYQDLTEEFTTLKVYDIVIVYGKDYNDPVADGYSKSLIELGHRDVRTLSGGLRAWKDDGNPVETGDAKPVS
jgi:rhodanese-related sulfurtransferase